MKGIVKRFPGVIALNKVDLHIESGEVLAVVGENGAGKSTLIKIMSGAYQQDEGQVFFEGHDEGKMVPARALELGITAIYQELINVKGLSISENIFLGNHPTKNHMVDYKTLYANSKAIQDEVGLSHRSPDELLGKLSTAEQQLVEIGRAYSKKLKVIIMDEPTSALNQEETDKLFALIRKLKAEGKGIIYISHKLDEVFEIADRVQVLRNGESVYEGQVANTTRDQIINSMCGRELKEMYPVSKRELGDVIFSIEGLTTSFLQDISINVREREIVGLYGLMGSGCSDVVECAFGKRPYKKGKFTAQGKEIKIRKPMDAINASIAYVPAERKKEGLMITHPVLNNLTIVTLKQFVRGLFLDLRRERETAKTWVDNYRIKTPTLDTPVSSMSGGNQQKIVISKWVAMNPKIFLLNDPTKGIDVGAKVEIYKASTSSVIYTSIFASASGISTSSAFSHVRKRPFAWANPLLKAALWPPSFSLTHHAILSEYFLTPANFKNIGVYMSASGIIAAGITVSMLLGGLDLSQMSIMAFSGIVVGVAYNAGVHGVWLMFVGIAVALLGGIFNSAIMNYLHINPIITTLGTQMVFRSLANMICDGKVIPIQDSFIKWIGRGRILGLPVTMCMMIVVYIIIGVVLKYTRFGRNLISVGGSEEAAYLCGINIKKTRTIAYLISAACAGLASLLYIAQGYVAQPNQGSGADMDCIAAVIIGGLSVAGGKGNVIGTLLGMLFFAVLANGMSLLSMSSYSQSLVKGILLLAAVYIDIVRNRAAKN